MARLYSLCAASADTGSAADVTRFAAENGLLPGASSPAVGESEGRTIVVISADDPDWCAELLHDAEARGFSCGRAPTTTLALAELREGPAASLLVIDDPAGQAEDAPHRVWAVASLPETDVGRWFVSELDRRPAGKPQGAMVSLSSTA